MWSWTWLKFTLTDATAMAMPITSVFTAFDLLSGTYAASACSGEAVECTRDNEFKAKRDAMLNKAGR